MSCPWQGGVELDDLEGLIQFRPFYDMLFQQVIHVCERDLMLIALLIFKNRELNGIAQCMHKLGLLELYQALERGSREVHAIPKMTAYDSRLVPHRSYMEAWHSLCTLTRRIFLTLNKNNWLRKSELHINWPLSCFCSFNENFTNLSRIIISNLLAHLTIIMLASDIFKISLLLLITWSSFKLNYFLFSPSIRAVIYYIIFQVFRERLHSYTN